MADERDLNRLRQLDTPWFWVMVAGVAILILDWSHALPIRYPEYISLADYGTETQKLVMGIVVGDFMKIDIISDALGFILLGMSSIVFFKRYRRFKGGSRQVGKRFIFATICCIVALALYIFRLFMPYCLNGVVLYGSEYAIHFVISAMESFAMYSTVAAVIYMLETNDVHQECVLGEVFLTISCICNFVRGMSGFYQIQSVAWIYCTVQIVFMILAVTVIYSGCRVLKVRAQECLAAKNAEADSENKEAVNDENIGM